MRTVTTREFYHNAKLVDALPLGGKLLVTSRGKPKFTVTRSGDGEKMTTELAEKLAMSTGMATVIDSTALLRDLRD